MRRFKWIEWNLQKIGAHALSADDVEASFDNVYRLIEHQDGSFQMFAETPAGRRIWIIWRYDDRFQNRTFSVIPLSRQSS
jgi:hypothetical protein